MIPPQAITTRDMTEAYRWLQSLPPSIRDTMKSMEQVVSLYLQSKRLGGLPKDFQAAPNGASPSGNTANENSKSTQEFQKTLKSISHELQQFDFSTEGVIDPPPASVTPIPTPQALPKAQSPSGDINSLRFDPKSRQIINEIRETLNLSSDQEVIRVCLVLGQRALKDLL